MRRRTGLLLRGVMLLLAAVMVGRGLSAPVRRWITPRRLLETAVRLETLTPRAPAKTAAPEAVRLEPTPEPTPEPTLTPEPTPDTPERTPDGLPILGASFPGGLTLRNATDEDPDLAALLAEGPSLRFSPDGPQVLIVHTHTSEAYAPSEGNRYEASDTMRTQDANFNILRVGDVLAAHLEAAGLTVLHDRTVNDYPSYAGAYARSGAVVERMLAEHPSIRMVIDLHRDALCSDTVVYKTVAELPDAESCAQGMFVVGTDGLGLEHPHWRENLKLAVWLQDAVTRRHPTLMRPIDLVRERYNQHLSTGMMLIEIGSSGNTLPEAVRAAELLGDAMGSALSTLMESGS